MMKPFISPIHSLQAIKIMFQLDDLGLKIQQHASVERAKAPEDCIAGELTHKTGEAGIAVDGMFIFDGGER